MDFTNPVTLIYAVNALSGRGKAGSELISADARSAAIRVSGILTRRLVTSLMGDGGLNFDLDGLGEFVRNLDALIVQGDSLPAALSEAHIALVWTLRNEILHSMATHPDGAALAASIAQTPEAHVARRLVEGQDTQVPQESWAHKDALSNAIPDAPAMGDSAAPPDLLPKIATAYVGPPEGSASSPNEATKTSLGLFSRALMHLHDAIEGKATLDTARTLKKPDSTSAT